MSPWWHFAEISSWLSPKVGSEQEGAWLFALPHVFPTGLEAAPRISLILTVLAVNQREMERKGKAING